MLPAAHQIFVFCPASHVSVAGTALHIVLPLQAWEVKLVLLRLCSSLALLVYRASKEVLGRAPACGRQHSNEGRVEHEYCHNIFPTDAIPRPKLALRRCVG